MCIFSRKPKKYDPEVKKLTIQTFEEIRFSESGMRYSYETIIKNNGETSEISVYYRHHYDEDQTPDKTVTVDTKSFLSILQECGVGSWNGFKGPHPKDVLDGRMFTLSGAVNGGERLYASGSENFPPDYRKFTDALRELTEK